MMGGRGAKKEGRGWREEVRNGERGVKHRRKGEWGRIQYIVNLADVIRLGVCQERRIS